jgi:uncharacterized protein with PQ loop repeat
LWRTGTAAGVSAVAAANAVTSATAWLAYGLAEDLPIVWIVSLIALVPGVWTLALLRREFDRPAVLGSALIAAAFIVSGVAGLLGLVLGLGVLVTAGPQVWRAVRDTDLTGIAPATWWIAVADAASWGLYGVVISDRAIQGYGIVLTASAAIVLARVAWVRRQTEALRPTAAV